jgi:hypothetical protein
MNTIAMAIEKELFIPSSMKIKPVIMANAMNNVDIIVNLL